jgi:hypothetical protein
MIKKEWGHNGFSKKYWDENYSELEEMDNIGNCEEHVRYLEAIFRLEQIEIRSVVDLGMGLGHLFREMVECFSPVRKLGVEPSEYAFNEALKLLIGSRHNIKKVHLKNIDLVTWAKNRTDMDKAFDLGICTSVFQYLKDEEIEFILPIMAKSIRYLYFSVPTDVEFKRQISEYDFFDEYSIHRTKEQYRNWISPHFTFVSNRVLESRFFFNDDNSKFKEQVFRF